MISLHTHYGCLQKYERCVGKTVEKSEPLCAVDGNVNERSHCGKQYEGSTVGYRASLVAQLVKIRERLPTPVFWPGEFHGLYSPWACKESDTTERSNPPPPVLQADSLLTSLSPLFAPS